VHTEFWSEGFKGGVRLWGLGLNLKLISKVCLEGTGWRGMDCIHLAQDRGEWEAVESQYADEFLTLSLLERLIPWT
jgi:hypothetical protein